MTLQGNSTPTDVQWAALKRWAATWGRYWKAELSAAWFNGNYHGSEDDGLLQQVRNTLGPRWLYSRKCRVP